MGWKVNWWARLLDGNRAYKLIKDQLSPAPVETKGQSGGTYPNLLDAHPPFQIDGNFGCTSGIAEMLVQSYDGDIFILPALPDELANGSVSGLKTRGGFEVAMSWENGELKTLKVKSTLGGNCRLRLTANLNLQGAVNLHPAQGENKNPFFKVNKIKSPLRSEEAEIIANTYKATKLLDFETVAGKEYIFNVK